MNMQEIRVIARNIGVKPGKMTKVELVRAVQREEGNFDCFATAANESCGQGECLWLKDCGKMAP